MATPLTEERCIDGYQHLFKPDLLRGKVALVTGGGSGIGFTITEILMRHGCRSAIASRNLERVQQAARTLEGATGQACLPLQMDVRKPQDVLRAVDETLAKFGRIDILVNNAAGNFLSPAAGLSFNGFKTVLEIDTMGTFNVSKAVFEKYFGSHGGVIVNISATLDYRGQVFQTHAGAAKAAIDAMTRHLAVEWGPKGVRVVGVAPGPIEDTEGVRRLGGVDPNSRVERTLDIPLRRSGRREEIGHAVLFLVSPAGSLVTGHTLVADGGAWMGHVNSMSEAERRMKSFQAATRGSKL